MSTSLKDLACKEMPLVSILIPLYNAEDYIGNLIEWCLNQPYKNIEVVVVDDHSTDNSYAIAKRYEGEKVHIYTNPKKGAQSARNYAFAMSRGQLVKFHDADDYCSDNLILRQVERMLKDGDEDSLVFSIVRCLKSDGSLVVVDALNNKDLDVPLDFLFLKLDDSYYNPHRFLLSRKLVEKIGGWDESVKIFQDTIFFVKAIEKASKMLYVEDEYAVWRLVDDASKIHYRTSDRMINALPTICDIADIMLKYRNDDKAKSKVKLFLGLHIYNNIKYFRNKMPYVEEILRKRGLEWKKITNPRLKFLYSTLGWARATVLIKRLSKFSKRMKKTKRS